MQGLIDGRSPYAKHREDLAPALREHQGLAQDLAAGDVATGLPTQAQALALGRLVARADQWRLFPELGPEARYLDIETTGLEPTDTITLVGVSDGHRARVLVQGEDLDARALGALLAHARLLVTFNGSAFDLPRLRRAFPGLPWELPHFDLAVEGRQVGLHGGLKAIEHALGRRRPHDLRGAGGLQAALLWRAHLNGCPHALRRLVRYCRADVESLIDLAPRIHARLIATHGEQPSLLRPPGL